MKLIKGNGELTTRERINLLKVLTEHLGIRFEGAQHLDATAFKDQLKKEELVLQRLIERCKPETGSI